MVRFLYRQHFEKQKAVQRKHAAVNLQLTTPILERLAEHYGR